MAKIRRFKIPDLDRVTEIRKNSLPNPWPKSLFEKMYRLYPEYFFVAEEKGKVIGYITGQIRRKISRINSLAVDKKWRKRGIGRTLANHLIDEFKRKRVKEIFLHVRTWNKKALNFYQNLGFKIIKTIKKYYKNEDDAYLMKKEI